ncbi:hypothetical protein P170DRAFT_514153 [Aspergillus steynii IBT 23096]|uniref:DUF7905 domain-containing protein n=1 Tax=Aspergillus steynii IBT 23096 TaxID=1392250 RepID=A0A2I2FT79_9EURO|nr:uncharacterized protein P170DRAFT_514153 [Aspergillus steynii IBT 23096]PLB43845.1 hypothetical protein P170DRAFT_514153 [Aspergillus steynii IBT 23096]
MDHETSGAQEWHLPGYGRIATKPAIRHTASETRESTSKPPTPKKPQSQQPKDGVPIEIPSGKPSFENWQRGPPRPQRGRGGFRGKSSSAAPFSSRQSRNLFQDSPSKSKWRAGSEPAYSMKLPATFGSFKHEFFGVARTHILGGGHSEAHARQEVFDAINKKTGAYVKSPYYDESAICIWGETAQVTAAKELLEGILSKCISLQRTSNSKRFDWSKIAAYSDKKEATAEMREKHESMVVQLRKKPDMPYVFPEQLLFLWPKEGPSIKEALGQDLEALDLIRSQFFCHVFVLKDVPDFICVLGNDHDTIKQIAHRLRTKWAEVTANSNIRSKIYIVEPPDAGYMKGRVVVEESDSLHKASLSGSPLKGPQVEYWRNRAKLIRSKNDDRILSAIEKSLKGLVFVRGYLRMRVNLGSFILENYRLPADNKPSYGFEEFRQMLLNENTKGRLIPGLKVDEMELLSRCYKATHLFEPCENTSASLKDVELAYSVNFEFLGSNNSMLRLEAEFSRRPGAQEYEITQRRWLRPRASGQYIEGQSPLQIGVIDFERSDWQLEVKSLEFYEASSIDAALKSFSHSIGFRRSSTMGDICAKPQRKVVFPPSAPVARFVEKTAIRYRLKGTEYIFEIARYDEYGRINAQGFPGQSLASMTCEISDIPSTSWGASVFAANWDMLLGQHGDLSVGHSAQYNTNLDTFFPTQTATPFEGKHAGFWEFITLVKELAAMLGSTAPNSTPNVASIKNPGTLLQTDLGTLF